MDGNKKSGENFTIGTKNRCVVVKTTDGQVIRGKINLDSDIAPMDRVSDFMIKGQNKFLIMYEATVQGRKDAVIIVNKNQIVWIMEENKGQCKVEPEVKG